MNLPPLGLHIFLVTNLKSLTVFHLFVSIRNHSRVPAGHWEYGDQNTAFTFENFTMELGRKMAVQTVTTVVNLVLWRHVEEIQPSRKA